MLTIRAERDSDQLAVFEVNREVFDTDTEARLVDALREEASPVPSFVAEQAGIIVGHIFFSPLTVDGKGGGVELMGLAPMAVREKSQRKGIGRQLIERGLDECRKAGARLVFVLGHPDYYPRFGFQPVAPLGLHYTDPKLNICFFVKELEPGALRGVTGTVAYHPAFDRTFGAG